MPAHQMHRTPSLRYYRDEAMLTQGELAALAGVARSTIAPLEIGSRGAFPSTIRKLAAALNVSPRELTQEPPAGKEPAPVSQVPLFHSLPDESRRALETLSHYTDRLEEKLRLPHMRDEEIVAYVGIVHVASAMIPPLLADPEIQPALKPLTARFERAGSQLLERVKHDTETEQVKATVHYLAEHMAA